MSNKEMVDHPEHYGGDTNFECIKVLEAWNTREEFIGFCKDNAIKYLCRATKKSNELQDLKKAAWYIKRAVEYVEKSDVIDLEEEQLTFDSVLK